MQKIIHLQWHVNYFLLLFFFSTNLFKIFLYPSLTMACELPLAGGPG